MRAQYSVCACPKPRVRVHSPQWSSQWVGDPRSGWEGLGCEQECWVGRGAVLVLGAPTSVHVLVSLEGSMCACTRDLLSVPAWEEEGTGLSVVVWCASLCLGAAEGSALSVVVCGSSVCVHVRGCLWDRCSALLPFEPEKGKAVAASLSLGRDSGSLGWAPADRQEQSWAKVARGSRCFWIPLKNPWKIFHAESQNEKKEILV